MASPLISIVITTKNEESVIGRLLESIKQQTYSNFEIILVDNNSTDKTRTLAKDFTKLIYKKGPERSTQRNFGAKKSKGAYLLFLDADMKLTTDVLKACVKEVQAKRNIGAIAIPEVSVATSYWEKVKAFERAFYNDEGDTTTDAARFFPRSAFKKVGGYDETITGPEDWDLPERVQMAGFKISRINEIIYHYERVKSPFFLAKKKFYYALTSHRYLKKHNISLVSAKTIYFLRPVFYKNWRRLVAHPFLSLGMIFMFTLELTAGGVGFILGKLRNL